jgi:hypothetical protein
MKVGPHLMIAGSNAFQGFSYDPDQDEFPKRVVSKPEEKLVAVDE